LDQWQALADSPKALSRFVLAVEAAFEDQDQALAQQQRLLDESSAEALRLNQSLKERAESLEQALQAREKDQQDLNEARQRLLNQEKLASIGTLAAGIAHEINTPTQFVGDNLSFLNDAFKDLLRVVEGLLQAQPGYKAPEGVMDLDFLRAEIPDALSQSLEGLERVAKIVRSVKEFSHPGSTGRLAVDLNRAIQSTLTVCRNEWKYVAEVRTELEPELPLLPCVPGEVNQVLLNLVVNAAQAIEDRQRQSGQSQLSGEIAVRTRREGGRIHVSVQDNGCGIPTEVAGRIFDPFFTTKEVGRGSGQGLAIARSVIVNHGGELSFETRPGEGSTFHLWLPLAGSPT
jgi:signal transduction histidine kinase